MQHPVTILKETEASKEFDAHVNTLVEGILGLKGLAMLELAYEQLLFSCGSYHEKIAKQRIVLAGSNEQLISLEVSCEIEAMIAHIQFYFEVAKKIEKSYIESRIDVPYTFHLKNIHSDNSQQGKKINLNWNQNLDCCAIS